MPDKNKLVELTDAVEYSEPPSSLSKDIADVESNGGNYSAYNTSGKHPTYALGKYQFVPSYHWDDIQKVTGVKTHQEFLHDPQAQEDYYKWHVEHHLKPGIERMREFNKAGYNENKLAALVHFKGEGGAKDWLTNGVDKTKENNVSIPDYIGEPEGNDLKELVGAEEIPDDLSQKKSPDVSADGVADNSQPGQNGVSQNNQTTNIPPTTSNETPRANGAVAGGFNPQSANDWKIDNLGRKLGQDPGASNTTASNTPIEGLTEVDPLTHLPVINGNQTQSVPVASNESPKDTFPISTGGSNTESLSPEIANTLTPVDPTTNLPLLPGQKPALERPEDAANILASHIIDNSHPSYLENLRTTSFNEKGSVVHDTTDPHGDPKRTGDYTQYATTQLEHQRQAELNKLSASSPADLPSSDASLDPGYQNAENEINKKYDNQIAQVHKAGKTLTGAQIAYQEFTQNKNKGEDSPARVNALNQQEEDELSKAEPQQKAAIKLKYAGLKRAIKPSEQYDAVRMGLQQQAMLGDKVAQDDLNKYINGIAIDKNRRVDYQYAGLKMRQNAARLAKENGQEDIVKEVAPKSDDIYSTLEKDNPEYFGKLYGNKIGSYAFNNEKNPLYGTIFTRPELTPDEIKEYGKKAGLTPQQIAMVKPEYVPTASSVYGQAAQAALNALPGISPTGRFSKVFTGEMPVEQHQMDNWKGFLGEMAGGVGTVASFMAQGGLVGEALKGAEVLGKVATAGKRYETASNLLPLAINNYNRAYENSKTVIGDSPKDEVNRQTYAIVNTILGTAIMSIDPVTALGKDALGMSKAGKDFIKTLKTEGIENLTKPVFQSKIAKVIQGAIGTGEHTVKQATIMASTKAAENITDMLYDPDHRHGIMDNTGEVFMRGGVGMFLPSLFAAKHAVNNQSEINKKMAFDVGLNSQQYRGEVTDLYKQGKLTKGEFHTALDGINSLSRIIKVQLPYVKSIDGKDLTMQQKQDYSWSLLKTEDLNKRLAALENSPDKAQQNQVNTLLKSEEKTRTDILNNAGEVQPVNKPFQPQTEPSGVGGKPQEALKLDKSTEELQPTGAIATEPAKVPEGETQKINEEKLVNTENTSIPLDTQTEVNDKNVNENEIRNQAPSGQERQDNIIQPQDQGNEVQQEANSAGRNEPQEDRQLSEKTSEENKAGVETPAKPVLTESGKKLTPKEKAQLAKAKKVPVTETEEPLPSGPQKPASDASPQTEQAGNIIIAPKGESVELPGFKGDLLQEASELNQAAKAKAESILRDQNTKKYNKEIEQSSVEPQVAEAANSNSTEGSPKKIKPQTEFQTRKKAALSGEPSNFREAVLHLIVGGERVNPKDLTQDLGISGNDMKPYLRRISGKGTSVDNFVERYVKDETNQHKIGFIESHPDATQEARREFMDVWQQYAHDDHAALEELERLQGKGHQKWEEEKYSAHTEGEKLSSATEDEVGNFLDHGDFESHQKATETIRDAELTDKDSDHIISYLSSHINDEGKVDHHTALDNLSGDFKEMYDNLSPAGKALFDSLLAEKESGGFVELNEKQKADFKKLQDEAATQKTTRSNSEPSKGPESESTPAGSDQRKNNEPVATKEKLNPSTQPTGAIATEAKSEEQSSATKEIENKISLKQAEIDHQKKILAAAHNTISKSLKSGDIEAHNKALAEAKQAEELIRKKEKSLKSLQEEQKIKSGYNQTADALEGHFDKLRKRKEESSLAGLGLPDHVTKWLEDKVVELLRQTGNLHVALHRGIELMKAKFGELVEHITTSDAEELRASLPFAEKPQEKEPIFTGTKTNAEANREYAQGYIDGIRDKSISHEDAEYEILDDEDLSPEEKGQILNYIDWDLNNEIPDKDNKVASYDLKDSGLSNFLGTETTKDVVGEDHLFDNPDEKKNAVRLTDLLDDAKNITQSYQNEGGPASKWGKRMYEDILKVNNDPKKQGAFIAGLHIELQSAHFENQKNINELDEALKAEKSPDKIQELQDRRLELIKENAKLERVIGDVQNFGKKLASTASDVMNTRRLDRMLRDDILKDYYHDKILNEQEIRRQRETEAALNQSIIEDYKNHPQYKKDMDEAKRSAERKKKEGKKSSVIEKAKEKTKNAVNRLTGRSKDTIEKAKVKKEKAQSEFPRDEKGNIMTPEQFIEYIKKLKNPC